MTPSPSDNNGRDASGRFAPGNKASVGNPHAKKAGQLRSALFRSVTTKDIKAVVAQLVEQAKSGDVQAAKEVLLRTLGRPVEHDLDQRLERLEELIAQSEGAS